uniref:Uncharacterized protein n=1 Tax=Sciurus vulgaris TaxID=55149 RepID=A0A8D2CN00_SCIVU
MSDREHSVRTPERKSLQFSLPGCLCPFQSCCPQGVTVFSGLPKEQAKVVRSGGVPVHLETMDPGATYCVKAQSLVKAIGRCSAFSQAECVEVQGEALPLALALFAFVGFMLILVVVPLSIWKMGQLLRYSCCPAVVLPDTLKITNSPQKLISCRREEVDVCATAVLSSEELFRAWILNSRT